MKLFFERLAYARQLLTRQFYPYRGKIILLLFFAVAKILSDIALAMMLIPLLNEILELPAEEALPQVWFDFVAWAQATLGIESVVTLSFVVLISIAVFRCVFAMGYFYLLNVIQFSYENDSRVRLFDLIVHLDWLFYTKQKMGDLVNAPLQETNRSSSCFLHLMSTVEGGLTVLFFIVAAFILSPIATSIALAGMFLFGLSVIPLAYSARHYGQLLVRSRNSVLHHLGEFVSALKVVKGSGVEKAARSLVEDESRQMRKHYVLVGLLKHLPGTLIETVAVLAILLLVFGIKQFNLIVLSQAAVVAVLMYRGLNRITTLQNSWIGFAHNATSMSAIDQLQKRFMANQEIGQGWSIETFQNMTFSNMCFAYGSDKNALENIDLSIQKGEFIGITGGSGSGKTTFVDIVLGLLKPQKGEIRINEIPFEEVNPEAWRKIIGYVPQESLMFNDTVYNNIALHDPSIQENEVIEAARTANAMEFIEKLPEGLQTFIGDRGMRLSGGQRQRVALARALVKNPQLLVLDEATSSLDSDSEQKIMESIEHLHGQLTIISVAHRLSTIMGADKIVVLDQGKIIEQGVPSVLMEQAGRFQDMYALQMG